MLKNFENWLLQNNYKPTTAADYMGRIERLCRNEQFTLAYLVENLSSILPQYETTGEKSCYGKRSHTSVRQALRRFQMFLASEKLAQRYVMTDIKTLNDNLRKTFIGGRVILTQGINVKMPRDIARILAKVRNFNNFTKANDPYNEHDFGSFDYNGEKIYWKIDYYDKSYCYLSENPANPDITNRVLTIMLASEY